MLSNQSVRNEKPQVKAGTKTRGNANVRSISNSTPMLKDSKSRYEKGMGLYKSGRVSIGSNGFFKVSGFQVDTEGMQCECPDYKTRKEACKHLFAAMLFVKNRGKQRIEHLESINGNGSSVSQKVEHREKPFDRQSTITRLAVLNTATEILKTHRKPIEFSDIVSLAALLEKWALGN